MLKLTETLLTNTFYYLLLIVSSFSIGVFAGALYYIRKYPMELSFSDIGAMLAGLGTVGLFCIAIKTSRVWKNNIIETEKRKTLSEWHRNSLDLYLYLNNDISLQYINLYHVKFLNDMDQEMEQTEEGKKKNRGNRRLWRTERNAFRSSIDRELKRRTSIIMDCGAILEIKLFGLNIEHEIPNVELILENMSTLFSGEFKEGSYEEFEKSVADYYQQQKSFHCEVITKLNS